MNLRQYRWPAMALVVVISGLAGGYLFLMRDQGQKLPGRHPEYHKVYDGWWDVACDTAMDGSDRRCYVQYVDIYSPRPNFRAAMVEVIYRKADDGAGEPIVTFDLEPDLSFADAEISVGRADGSQHPLQTGSCTGPKCSISGDLAAGMLAEWRQGDSLILTIREHDGKSLKRSWPLGNINAILDDFNSQRLARNLP